MDNKIISKEIWPKLIGIYIRKSHIRKGMAQAEVAYQINSSESHISNIKNGKAELGSFLFVRIQDKLDLHPAEYTAELNKAIAEHEKEV